MEHKHLLINATFKSTPFKSTTFTEAWIRDLVKKIDMNILYHPVAVGCDQEGNEGVSAFCLITTSHIALHSWEKREPNLVQLDIYSCKKFEESLVLDEIKKFNPLTVGKKFLDRRVKNTKGWQLFNEDLL